MPPPNRPTGSGRSLRIAIKIATETAALAHLWGDTHFAASLAAALSRLGHSARVDLRPDWAETGAPFARDDLHLVLQGHGNCPPQPGIPSMVWLIYPGRDFDEARLAEHAHAFVASSPCQRGLARDYPRLSSSVLHQAFDATRMRPRPGPRRGLVFVGHNNFAGPRPLVEMAIAAGLPLRIWGTGWRRPHHARHLVAEFVPNAVLGAIYAGAQAVLCDHRKRMRARGFVSNRIFDALGCGTPVIADGIAALPRDLAPFVTRIDSPEGLIETAGRALTDSVGFADDLHAMAARHSFDARARTILETAAGLGLT